MNLKKTRIYIFCSKLSPIHSLNVWCRTLNNHIIIYIFACTYVCTHYGCCHLLIAIFHTCLSFEFSSSCRPWIPRFYPHRLFCHVHAVPSHIVSFQSSILFWCRIILNSSRMSVISPYFIGNKTNSWFSDTFSRKNTGRIRRSYRHLRSSFLTTFWAKNVI
jgi:hypothetical protein